MVATKSVPPRDKDQNRFAGRSVPLKKWPEMSMTERQILVINTAKKNLKLRQWKGEEFWYAAKLDAGLLEQEEVEIDWAERRELQAEVKRLTRQNIASRCRVEVMRSPFQWKSIVQDQVVQGWQEVEAGMFYGIEFPLNAEMLLEWGPKWLTRAFHAANTLPKTNKVTRITMEKKRKITTGNNGNKFLFEVEYLDDTPDLHKKLFCKIPFPCAGATKTDRISSSVNKQPQEFYEINTSRLLESALPVAIPRFYYGDISNVTSNWILITERIEFKDYDTNFGRPIDKKKKPLLPYEIEGPYDKCIDHNLRGPDDEYYMLLVKTGAKIAGMYKAGYFGSEEMLKAGFGGPFAPIDRTDLWQMKPNEATGDIPGNIQAKLTTAVKFISETAQVLFPPFVKDESWAESFKSTVMTLNAYAKEIDYWKHSNPDYTALCHTNLNVDNVYFWRDENGELDVGVFDWGGMSATCLGHKLWWWLYCMDYEPLQANWKRYLDVFIATYKEHGGPELQRSELEMQFILTSMEQMIGLIGAVPLILKTVPTHAWMEIEDRWDRRIAENIDGKSSIRLYLHVMHSIIRIMNDMDGEGMLRRWIDDVWVGKYGQSAKTDEAINVKSVVFGAAVVQAK
eukprot:gnl/TRDRNA2_/TRDRNA2_167454_c0_seq1.p1 gnl/TRDRNA2_/TRDRNA2_167454_c0~~gnl/TRDRNA2_/TRDRNA2_167454_c0_seq1.p1  ORF type:complete len:691 (+),score=142.20 gnl/TRDRNA2_/TRDRNA2_167454_c0_seq1:207-2075(+)